jgi:Zn-dependent M16 (insulinase) family peptidase
LLRSLYSGKCGYKSETGGMLKDVRALDINTIRKYYKDIYRPDNLCLIIVGDISVDQVIGSLSPYIEGIVKKGISIDESRERPWSSIPPPLTSSSTYDIQFPSEDESMGSVYIGWRGPDWTDFESLDALHILWTYLTDSTLAPLQRI